MTTVQWLSVPDVVSSDAQRFQADRVPVLDDHLDGFEVSVHGDVHTRDRPVNLSPVLKLHRHCLVGQFHQKSGKEIFVTFLHNFLSITVFFCHDKEVQANSAHVNFNGPLESTGSTFNSNRTKVGIPALILTAGGGFLDLAKVGSTLPKPLTQTIVRLIS